MDDLNHTSEPIDFNFLTSMQIKDGRICSSWKDTEAVKSRFSGVSTYKAAVGITAAIGDSVTPTSSTKNEQDENTLYAFYYYQIGDQDRNCSCYVCSDLAAFKPKKQNDASLVSVTKKTTQEESIRMTVVSPPPRKEDFQNEEGKEKCTDNDGIPTRFCKYCGVPIRWELFKSEKTIHPESMFHWQRKVIENWVPSDFYTGEKHQCHRRSRRHRIDKEEVAA